MILNDFHTVCAWEKFPNKEAWKYDLMLSKSPVESQKIWLKKQGELSIVFTRLHKMFPKYIE
jgi:hypothetical protein